MLDPKWFEAFNNSDTQFVALVVSAVFLLHWLFGWPANVPSWIVLVFWILFLFALVSLALKAFGLWFESQHGRP